MQRMGSQCRPEAGEPAVKNWLAGIAAELQQQKAEQNKRLLNAARRRNLTVAMGSAEGSPGRSLSPMVDRSPPRASSRERRYMKGASPNYQHHTNTAAAYTNTPSSVNSTERYPASPSPPRHSYGIRSPSIPSVHTERPPPPPVAALAEPGARPGSPVKQEVKLLKSHLALLEEEWEAERRGMAGEINILRAQPQPQARPSPTRGPKLSPPPPSPPATPAGAPPVTPPLPPTLAFVPPLPSAVAVVPQLQQPLPQGIDGEMTQHRLTPSAEVDAHAAGCTVSRLSEAAPLLRSNDVGDVLLVAHRELAEAMLVWWVQLLADLGGVWGGMLSTGTALALRHSDDVEHLTEDLAECNARIVIEQSARKDAEDSCAMLQQAVAAQEQAEGSLKAVIEEMEAEKEQRDAEAVAIEDKLDAARVGLREAEAAAEDHRAAVAQQQEEHAESLAQAKLAGAEAVAGLRQERDLLAAEMMDLTKHMRELQDDHTRVTNEKSALQQQLAERAEAVQALKQEVAGQAEQLRLADVTLETAAGQREEDALALQKEVDDAMAGIEARSQQELKEQSERHEAQKQDLEKRHQRHRKKVTEELQAKEEELTKLRDSEVALKDRVEALLKSVARLEATVHDRDAQLLGLQGDLTDLQHREHLFRASDEVIAELPRGLTLHTAPTTTTTTPLPHAVDSVNLSQLYSKAERIQRAVVSGRQQEIIHHRQQHPRTASVSPTRATSRAGSAPAGYVDPVHAISLSPPPPQRTHAGGLAEVSTPSASPGATPSSNAAPPSSAPPPNSGRCVLRFAAGSEVSSGVSITLPPHAPCLPPTAVDVCLEDTHTSAVPRAAPVGETVVAVALPANVELAVAPVIENRAVFNNIAVPLEGHGCTVSFTLTNTTSICLPVTTGAILLQDAPGDGAGDGTRRLAQRLLRYKLSKLRQKHDIPVDAPGDPHEDERDAPQVLQPSATPRGVGNSRRISPPRGRVPPAPLEVREPLTPPSSTPPHRPHHKHNSPPVLPRLNLQAPQHRPSVASGWTTSSVASRQLPQDADEEDVPCVSMLLRLEGRMTALLTTRHCETPELWDVIRELLDEVRSLRADYCGDAVHAPVGVCVEDVLSVGHIKELLQEVESLKGLLQHRPPGVVSPPGCDMVQPPFSQVMDVSPPRPEAAVVRMN